jgi:hypothetical protein
VNTASIPAGWSDTAIVMIPKVDNPKKEAQFCPISMCNVVYKMISKMLANRLKCILPEIIGENQSAFVSGCLITDNILIAYECIHAIKRKKGKQGLCTIKLDMHKAYDRVEWGFLEKIMIKIGFDAWWVNLIMACVSSVRYTIRSTLWRLTVLHPPGYSARGPFIPLFVPNCRRRPILLDPTSRREG